MSIISKQALNYVAARDDMKLREDAARTDAILRTMNKESEALKDARLKLSAARATMIFAIALNFYAAAKGWGVL